MILASGSKNYVTAQFDLLTEDWTAPITAIFNEYTVVLDENNQCLVPWEVLANPGKVAVSAFCGDLHTATSVLVPVHPGGYIDGQTPQPPTPGVYEQLLGMVQTAVDTANDVKERADAGEFNGKDAPQIDDTQASPDHPWSGAKVDQEVKQLSEQIEKVNKEVADAREGYFGEQYDSLSERIDGDINNVLDKVNVVAYEGTSFHATNTYARNLNVNRNKVEILGQTIQNCLDHSSVDKFQQLQGNLDEDGFIVVTGVVNSRLVNIKLSSAIIKPSTAYTVFVEVRENTLDTVNPVALVLASYNDMQCAISTQDFNISPKSIGTFKKVITSAEDLSDKNLVLRTAFSSAITSGTIKLRYMLLEGDWTNKDISWVPFGLNTPQTTEVMMVGKNLVKKFSQPDIEQYRPAILADFIPEPNTTYFIWVDGNPEDTFYANENLFLKDTNFHPGEVIEVTTNSYSNTLRSSFYDQSTGMFIVAKNRVNNAAKSVTRVHIQRGGNWDGYEPCTENTVIINNPLRSVYDTIRDRLYIKDGKAYYEQNVGSVIINSGGSQAISSVDVLGDGRYVKIGMYDILPNIISGLSGSHNLVICDRLAGGVLSGEGKQEQVSIYWHSTRVEVRICVLSSRLTSLDKVGAQAFLQENPLLVFYPIEPVTTEISISDFYSYAEQTNWYTTNAVKPTLKAEIPSNIGAVVSSTIAENAALRQENAALSQQVAALSEELQVSKILLGVD